MILEGAQTRIMRKFPRRSLSLSLFHALLTVSFDRWWTRRRKKIRRDSVRKGSGGSDGSRFFFLFFFLFPSMGSFRYARFEKTAVTTRFDESALRLVITSQRQLWRRRRRRRKTTKRRRTTGDSERGRMRERERERGREDEPL